MKTFKDKHSRYSFWQSRGQKGAAAVEMALVLPLLLVLAFGLFEFARGILANNVITGMSREGANLYSRTGTPPGDIMTALTGTASQVNMVDNGIIYMTRIQQTGGNPQVLEQFRWIDSALTDPPSSGVWLCDGPSNWDGEQCDIGPAVTSATRTATLDMTLNDGEEIVAVEVFYVYRPAFDFYLKKDLTFYSRTLL
ncbi:TadE family protein [Syntrophotalea acetylenivorans]|uniref:TadE family protein n=1 Tax=Syntrophotalea acetylenivorans TaxID=1842532 RepID=UPI0009F89094|nr:TadE family protein [Syntrophotalea acetylenivorans]